MAQSTPFLSLSVTGINVAFSYIGNYFTNALVAKNQDKAYFYVGVYFSVGHRATILPFHNLVLDLQGQENWEVQSVETYINKKEGGQ